ncbi:hypothetical protein OD750_020490 [Tahibacter sp. BL]|uniref:Uncharacterized protein n=1 Tax=Tahibacter soli TaxID=2983605 RepID=A0A9X3YP85_9GAMM|nr:hypothetical protein [Tahibacter soli]MDC8014930.1 hypothetical protein [Tahibacter soli]
MSGLLWNRFLAQQPARAKQPRLDRADRHAEDVGDVAERELVEIEQRDRLAFERRQRGDVFSQRRGVVVRRLRVVRQIVERGGVVRDRLRVARSQMVDPGAPRDAEQPCPQARAVAQVRDAAKHAQPDVLRDVVRGIVAAGQTRDVVADRRMPARDHLVECLGLAELAAHRQPFVFASSQRLYPCIVHRVLRFAEEVGGRHRKVHAPAQVFAIRGDPRIVVAIGAAPSRPSASADADRRSAPSARRAAPASRATPAGRCGSSWPRFATRTLHARSSPHREVRAPDRNSRIRIHKNTRAIRRRRRLAS